MVACALSPVVYQMIQQNPENAANMGMLFSFYGRFTVDFTTNNFNSTFIPLAYSEGEGNCFLKFLICSMAVAMGLGVCMIVFLACCLFFAYLY